MYKFVESELKSPDENMQMIIDKHNLKKTDKLLKFLAEKFAKYQWKSFPHRMLLILDDFASHPLIRSKETEMSRLLKKLRHFTINVIICVQTSKSIPKEIKRIVSDVVLFPGISKDDFDDLMKEGPFGAFDHKTIYEAYRNLNHPQDMFSIHITAKRVIITPFIKNKSE
jgi:hypothetical protein